MTCANHGDLSASATRGGQQPPYVVITGAVGGFGIEFAKQFARRGYALCLSDINAARLFTLKADLEKRYQVAIDALAVDLGCDEGLQKLYQFCKDKDVVMLINNAGMAQNNTPMDADLDEEMRMLHLNVKAVHWLTRRFLSDMLAKNRGKILNMASLSAWRPSPCLNAYSAGKSYILHFSESLNFELEKMGSQVRVAVAAPGLMNTDIARNAGKELKDLHRSVPHYIERLVNKFLQGDTLIVIGQDRIVGPVMKLLPRKVAMAISYFVIPKMLVKPHG